MSKLNFSLIVEHTVKDSELSYIDAIVSLCEKYDIEFESMRGALNNNIKERIKLEAQKLNMMMDNDAHISLFQ